MMTARKEATPLDRVFSIKHEPQHLSEIGGHEDSITRLKKMIESGNVSNLLIAGPEGAGKLTLAKCFAKDLFGEEYATSVNIIHAANRLTDEERKQAARESHVSEKRIGSMAGTDLIFPKFIQVRVKPVVELQAMNSRKFKLLIVTGFDKLAQDQQGFRRLMEVYGSNCRFILITSQISSVIDPIISRCQVLLVKPLSRARFYKEVSRVGTIEGFSFKTSFANSLHYVTGGNIGKALNLMQLFKLKGLEINDDNLFSILKALDDDGGTDFLELCLNRAVPDAVKAYYQIKQDNALSFQGFLDVLRRVTIRAPLPKLHKARILTILADIDASSITKASDEPHVMALVLKLGGILAGSGA
ncbi:MAG: hypothetical protein GYA24_22990 [Candidatus Lokiarchaeota archaeon]|nr:hypothetical protein [Candidatus Lokiarchaeota archaeon]